MRLTFVLLTAFMLQLSAASRAQSISIERKNVSLTEVLKDIRQQTGLDFFYEGGGVLTTQKVNIKVKNVSIDEAMTKLLSGLNLSYKVEGSIVSIRKKEGLSIAQTFIDALLSIDVRGKVVDSLDNGIAGAIVLVKGTNNQTITSANGDFFLKNVNEGATLIISQLGLISQEIKAGTNPSYVKMKMSRSKLDEVQIIAYGTTSKRIATGATTSVKAEDIAKQPVSNPIIALQGRVPGFSMQQTTGVAGAAVRFNIRGTNSLSTVAGANDPFIIVDGVPFNNSNISLNGGNTLGAFGGASPLNSINPADIESIDVLKDADATAIYGSRGANGVILISTKKGKSEKSGVNVNISQGVGQLSRRMDMLNTEQYLNMRRQAFANDGVDWNNSNVIANDLKVWDKNRYTDWQDLLAGGTANYTNAQLGLTGGNQYTRFNVSGNYWRETTVFPMDFSNKKYSGRFGLSHKSQNERLQVEVTGTYTFNQNTIPAFSPYTASLILPPNAPEIYNPDGSLNWENNTFNNPMAQLLVEQSLKSNNLNVSTLISYQLWKGLSIKANVGYSKVDFRTLQKNVKASINPFDFLASNHYAALDNANNSGWNAEPYLEYQGVLGPGKISALLGSTFQEQTRTTDGIFASDFIDDALMDNPAAGKNITVQPSTITDYRYNAIFSRLNYNIQDKYIANITMRRDGSSRFGPGRQFGNFGAMGVAWIFSEEKFMKAARDIVSYGKLRASYGLTGSDAIGDYNFLSTYSLATNASAGRVALKPDRLFNPNYRWETNTKFDLELALGFIENKIMVSGNYYQNRSSSQLVGIPMPRTSGFTSLSGNLPATVQNTGLELSLNANIIKSKHFNWNSAVNLTIPKNKLISYPNLASSTNNNSYAIGYSLQLQKLYNHIGVDPRNGLNLYRGLNGVDTSFVSTVFFNQADRTVFLDNGPGIYGGISNDFSFKNFQLDFQFVYSKRNRNNDIAVMTGTPGQSNNISLYVYENSWKNAGEPALFQKFSQSTSSPVYRSRLTSSSDGYFTNTYLLRLNNLSLSYRLNQKLQERLHVNGARIYIQGQNLFTITNFKGVDPETGTSSMPLMRVMTAGIQFTL